MINIIIIIILSSCIIIIIIIIMLHQAIPQGTVGNCIVRHHLVVRSETV